MGKAIRASALILLLACTAQAGWMGNDAPAPPPPSQPASAVQEVTETQEPFTPATTEDSTRGTLTRIALTMLLSVLP